MSTPDMLHPINPTTGEAAEALACSTADQISEAVARARAAQPSWEGLGVEGRAACVAKLAERLSDDELVDALARQMALEMGKPIAAARSEVKVVAGRVQSFIQRAREACEAERTAEGRVEVDVLWRSLGVVGVIGPWNYPLSTPNSLVLSALLTGNCVVFKPSELTPRTGAAYHRVLSECLPEGVFGLVQGAGEVGAALVDSAVDMIAFTGSIGTGQAIMRAAAKSMKRLVLELGGKDPMIILPGADLEAAADHAARESVRNSGQVCVSVERVFVPDDVAEQFGDMLASRVAALKLGDPLDPDTDLGPMANEAQRKHVQAQLAQAEAAGAKVRVRGAASTPGFFLSPSVVLGVKDDMELAHQETFGPVVSVSSYSDVDEAISRANASVYGLGASVWGPEGEQTERVARALQAGMVGINRGLSAAGGAPWVGWKMSGFGYARSREGMRQFMVPQSFARARE